MTCCMTHVPFAWYICLQHVSPCKNRRTVQIMIWPRGYKTFFMLNSTEHEFFPPINVKMPSIYERENSILGLSEPKNAEFLDIFSY